MWVYDNHSKIGSIELSAGQAAVQFLCSKNILLGGAKPTTIPQNLLCQTQMLPNLLGLRPQFMLSKHMLYMETQFLIRAPLGGTFVRYKAAYLYTFL